MNRLTSSRAMLALLPFLAAPAAPALLWSSPAGAAEAGTAAPAHVEFSVVHHFNEPDGLYPSGELTQSVDGNLYGTTFAGGAFGGGTFYRMDADGKVTVLHDFGGPGDGHGSQGAPVETAEGVFYGTTQDGGEFNLGMVYRLTVDGAYEVIHSFADDGRGFTPAAPLIQARDGKLYGTATFGGKHGFGTIFVMTREGETHVLHQFGSVPGDGTIPLAQLMQARDGSLYGIASSGGEFNMGAIFRMTPSREYTVMHSFLFDVDGVSPGALMQAVDGNFYGVAGQGGGQSAMGTAYRMTPDGTVSVLHRFTGNGVDGAFPNGLLEAGDGYLYGTTFAGGSGSFCNIGCGTIFRMTLDGAVTILHDFERFETRGPTTGLTRTADRRLVGATDDDFGRAHGGAVFSLGEAPRP